MFKLLFESKWMYMWVPYVSICVYGGTPIVDAVVLLLMLWFVLNEVID